jgi:hypothetical protein
MRLRFLTMRERLEEEPEPDEPDEDEPAGAPSSVVPTIVGDGGGREFEYRTELVTAAQVVDGTTLAEHLTRASSDGWDLVDIIGAGDRHAILLRRGKRPDRSARRVGFTPPQS